MFPIHATETLAVLSRRCGRYLGLSAAVDVVLVASTDTGLLPVDSSHCIIDVLNRWRISSQAKRRNCYTLPPNLPQLFENDDQDDFELHIQQSRLDSRADVRRWTLAPVRECQVHVRVERSLVRWTGPDKHTSGELMHSSSCGASAARTRLVWCSCSGAGRASCFELQIPWRRGGLGGASIRDEVILCASRRRRIVPRTRKRRRMRRTPYKQSNGPDSTSTGPRSVLPGPPLGRPRLLHGRAAPRLGGFTESVSLRSVPSGGGRGGGEHCKCRQGRRRLRFITRAAGRVSIRCGEGSNGGPRR